MNKKIAIFTGSRAEYGLLYWLLKAIHDDVELELQLIVSGTHLSRSHGHTIDDILNDGFNVAAQVEMVMATDTAIASATSVGIGLMGMASSLALLKPDVLVVLGDRYEAFAAATAAMLCRVPLAHIHGGEATQGLIDEAIRHSITKMSHLHFVSTEVYRKRVIQLGEVPDRVWNVGATALDNIEKLVLLTKAELEASLELTLTYPVSLLTYHPVTLRSKEDGDAVSLVLNCLSEMGGTIIITGTNSDLGSDNIRAAIDKFVSTGGRVYYFESLGVLRYLSLMRLADVIIGNSSSAIIEAPALGVPSINIGDRQLGRIMPPSVIAADADLESINLAVNTALSDKHIKLAREKVTPYGTGGAADRIKAQLSKFDFSDVLVKEFWDI